VKRRVTIAAAAGLAMLASGLWAAAPSGPLLAEAPSETQATVLITGKLDPWRERIDFGQVTLTINGTPVELQAGGRYTARVPHADYYQLTIGGPAVFTMVQTFGPEELRDPACGCLAVPAIELVARKEGRIELFFAGDTMAGRRYLDPGKYKRPALKRDTIEADLAALLRPMQPYFVPSDLASLNLETVLADARPGGSPEKRFVFYSPTALAGTLKTAGIDYVTLGNNHTFDYLDTGLDLTVSSLDKVGLLHSGAGRDLNQAAAARRLDLGVSRLSLLGFVGSTSKFDPNLVAGPDKGGAMLGHRVNIAEAVEREIRADRATIVQIHTGTEYADEPNESGVKRRREAIDQGAALVVSHHPHVTQAFEVYRDRLIAYSLGNFMFDQNYVETMSSVTLKVWLDKGRLIRAEVIPIQILDYRPVPAVGAMREAALRRIFALSARRDTYFRMSGGHAVVRFDRIQVNPREVMDGPDCAIDGNGVQRLTFPLAAPFQGCQTPLGGRFGRDLLMRGDFDNARYDIAFDRVWDSRQANHEILMDRDGNQFLSLRPQVAGKPAILFTGPYLRYQKGEHISLIADVRIERAASIDLSIKPLRLGQPSTLPWLNGTPVGRIELEPAPGWQRIRIDFTRQLEPGKEPAPLRPIISVTYKQGKAAGVLPVLFDNMAFVEWEVRPEAELPPGERWLWTHWAR
jgi:poly-gamma-glutamate capsule biosynthesis protein CapA/YwtB (metallophosphatase superfamily)